MDMFLEFLDKFPVNPETKAVLEAVREGYTLLESSNKTAKKKKKTGELSHHAAQRRIERGLRPCDVAKILKLGTWEREDNGNFKVWIDPKNLYVIVAPDQKTIVTTVNNKMLNTEEIFKLVGDQARQAAKDASNTFMNSINTTGKIGLVGVVPKGDSGVIKVSRADRRKLAKNVAKDFATEKNALNTFGAYSGLCDDWKVK